MQEVGDIGKSDTEDRRAPPRTSRTRGAFQLSTQNKTFELVFNIMAGAQQDDPMDSLLSLEEQYYAEGHALGVADGSKAGRIEGRLFGLQKGFEKFAAIGDLAGQCALWEARTTSKTISSTSDSGQGSSSDGPKKVPAVGGDRLQKHIATLAALTELASLDTQNNEEAVSDFDERLKRAEGKVKIISSIVGEAAGDSSGATSKQSRASADKNMEDFTLPRNMKGRDGRKHR